MPFPWRFPYRYTDNKSTFEAEGRDDGGLVDDGGAGEGVDQAEDELLGQAPVKARPALYVQGASLAHTRAAALRRLRGSWGQWVITRADKIPGVYEYWCGNKYVDIYWEYLLKCRKNTEYIFYDVINDGLWCVRWEVVSVDVDSMINWHTDISVSFILIQD